MAYSRYQFEMRKYFRTWKKTAGKATIMMIAKGSWVNNWRSWAEGRNAISILVPMKKPRPSRTRQFVILLNVNEKSHARPSRTIRY